jgi:sugar transferase EpsL
VKRAFDLTVSAAALVALAPVLLCLWVLVRIFIGSPVLFRQERSGLGGAPFRIFKFRTMTDARDAKGRLEPDSARLMPFGAFLRAASLDELPELVNILRGEMSLAGPRPLLCKYLKLYTPEQARRHLVRPGITGWAQIHGRNALSWEQRLERDVWYVDHRSFWLDVKIIAITVWKVLRREGINQEGYATMGEFLGTRASTGGGGGGN